MDWQTFVPYGTIGWTKLEPGMLLKLKDGRVALVGSVNQFLSLCDGCCSDVHESSITHFCRIPLPCKVIQYV